MERINYPTSAKIWRGDAGSTEGNARICDESGQELVQLPIEFLRLGQVQTVAFALQMVAFTFVEPGTLLRDGQQLQPDGQVTAGDYVFRRDDALQEPCTPHTGPRGKIKHTPFSGDEASSSTMSNSKRSSAHQSRFCFQVAARDSLCLVTGADPEDCTAAHILPVTRLDYYVEVLGNDRDVFEPSAGLFLRDDLHHAFDRFEFAFWPLANGDLVVHIFNAKSTRRSYHGKVVPMAYFRCVPTRRPDPRLLLFHYQQCAMCYLRGWSSFPSLPTGGP
ncbi:hypothetical protein OC844_002819 [Tilletia horrida]|nr:hypothetical protein OC844_002819 [Tilletia horrida]